MTTPNTNVPAPVNYHPFAPTGEVLELTIDIYNKTKKLPTYPFITCTRTGRNITMFGDNLYNRVAKFGGIRELLTTFICNDAKKADKLAGIIHADQPKSAAGFQRKSGPKTREVLELELKLLQAQLAATPATTPTPVAPTPVVEAPVSNVPTVDDLMSVFQDEEQKIIEDVIEDVIEEQEAEQKTDEQIMAELEAEEANA